MWVMDGVFEAKISDNADLFQSSSLWDSLDRRGQ